MEMRKIRIDYADFSMRISQRSALKQVILEIFQDHSKELERLQYVLCSDEYLLNINKEFLDHDTYTDIITFTLSDPGEAIAGEVYISLERVQENAAQLSLPVQTELRRVFIHGALHLCGYLDKSAAAKRVMTKREDFYLGKFKV
jgi:probable rRNA maturation factor